MITRTGSQRGSPGAAGGVQCARMPPSQCPSCSAPRGRGTECPACGVVYAKAEARALRTEREPQPPQDRPGSAVLDEIRLGRELQDARLELVERTWAFPVALVGCFLLVKTGLGHFLLRTFLGMWVHELGHAVTAWFCGIPALPGPWITLTGSGRSFLVTLALGGALAYLVWHGRSRESRVLVALSAVLMALQLVGTFLVPFEKARALVTFGGDAGCLVLGSALIATAYLDPEHHLRRQWLHWGFLVIGAAAFTDTFEQWWSARTDFSRIPFGELEGSGALSDPSALVQHGWTAGQIVHRYVGLGVLCLVVLVALYTWYLKRARAALDAAEQAAARLRTTRD